jgi:hypothetical protein
MQACTPAPAPPTKAASLEHAECHAEPAELNDDVLMTATGFSDAGLPHGEGFLLLNARLTGREESAKSAGTGSDTLSLRRAGVAVGWMDR